MKLPNAASCKELSAQNVVISFALPGTNHTVREEARAVKSYDNYKVPGSKSNELKKLTELHFLKISETNRSAITKYLMRAQVQMMKKKR